ncbi:MAG: hypothetical protein IT204_23225 [Fimbriimonadaceae bacterium]|nr:hypothetical protein [Fimbriimonadaceae bacterium]
MQSAPPLLPPYSSGSFQSRLLPLLQAGHGGTRLAAAELRTLATWLDLLVPYCGDYTEAHAWSPEEVAKYQHFSDKRRRLATP